MPDSGTGDIVMSVLDLKTFRAVRGDIGPDYIWYPCDNSPLAGTKLGPALQNTPDFRGRYPRGWDNPQSVPDRAPNESAAPGTVIGQKLLSHTHKVTIDISHFSGGDDEHGPVWNPAQDHHSWDTDSNANGSSENRPNSVVVFFYIRAN